MMYLGALLIFAVLAAVTWFVAVAVYQGWVGGPDVRQKENFAGVSALAIGLVALASFVPYLAGYVICLAIWLYAATQLELPWPRAVALFLILAALSIISRLAVLGALEAFWPAPTGRAAAAPRSLASTSSPWAATR